MRGSRSPNPFHGGFASSAACPLAAPAAGQAAPEGDRQSACREVSRRELEAVPQGTGRAAAPLHLRGRQAVPPPASAAAPGSLHAAAVSLSPSVTPLLYIV